MPHKHSGFPGALGADTLRVTPIGERASFSRPLNPPLRFDQDAFCAWANKRRFASFAEAEQELERQQALPHALGYAPIAVYQCPSPDCGGWHLTSVEQRS